MDILNWRNTLVISGPVLCGLAFKLIKNRIGNQRDSAINEVLFYGADNQREKKEIGLENLLCISYVISHASKTVDVCVPSLKSETLTKCLINVHEKNKAKIRVAIHDSDHFSNLKSFAQHAIEVKVIKSAVRLEHEFILMDAAEGSADAVALLGSLDYEAERVNCAWDTTMLTSEQAVVTNLQREFERIWSSTPEFVRANDKTN